MKPLITSKSVSIWRNIALWCIDNVGKKAAIFTHEGYFEITYKPKSDTKVELIIQYTEEE